MKEKQQKYLGAVIYAMSLLIMSNVAISPGLGKISSEFQEIPEIFIQMLITLPALLMVPASFTLNWLVKKFRLKLVIIWTLIVFLICGLLPVVVYNFWIILFLRAVQGFTVGIISPLTSLMVTYFFSGDLQLKAMGRRTAVESIGAVLMMMVGGVLADMGWKYVFTIFVAAFPILLFVIKCMPDVQMYDAGKDRVAKTRKKLEPIIGLYVIVSFVYMAFLHCFSTNIAMFMEEQAFGMASGSGVITSAYMVSGFVCGLIFAKVAKLCGKYTMNAGLLLSAIGILGIGIARNFLMVLIASLIAGFGMGVVLAISVLDVTAQICQENKALAIALLSSFSCLAEFVSPFVVTPAASLFGEGLVRVRYQMSGIVLIVVALVFTGCQSYMFKKRKMYEGG